IQKYYGVHLDFELNYREIIRSMLEWLIWKHPVQGEVDFMLSALEEAVGRLSYAELITLKPMYQGGIKLRAIDHDKLLYLGIARWLRSIRPESWTDQHHASLWSLVSWLNEPEPGLPGNYSTLDDLLLAYEAGAATRADLFYMF